MTVNYNLLSKPRAKSRDIEHKIQVALITWYDRVHGDGLLFAVPNGGRRDAITGARLKAEGVRAGVWDLFHARSNMSGIPWFHGLWIEVKDPARRNKINGGLTAEQVTFRDRVRRQGYATEIIYSTQEGIDAITRYLIESK